MEQASCLSETCKVNASKLRLLSCLLPRQIPNAKHVYIPMRVDIWAHVGAPLLFMKYFIIFKLLLGCWLLIFNQAVALAAQGTNKAPSSRSATSMFATPKSPGSIAVGVAEGNFTQSGEATQLYSGHTDPGNHVTNKGFCSWNRAANITVAEADKRCLASLQKQSAAIAKRMKELGIDPTKHLPALVNGTDVWNQSNSAGPEFVSQYKAALDLGLRGKASYIWARVEAFRNAGGALDASGLFGICKRHGYYQQRLAGLRVDSELWRWQCIGLDQRRRVELISNVLRLHLGEIQPAYPAVPNPSPSPQVESLVLSFNVNSSPSVVTHTKLMVLDFTVEGEQNSSVVSSAKEAKPVALSFEPPSIRTQNLPQQQPSPAKVTKSPTAKKQGSGSGVNAWTPELKKTLKIGDKVTRYRVVSPYGKRIHPITGQWQFHGGVDLDTPTATPIYAIGKSGSQTTLKCWYDTGGGGLVATMSSPSLPSVKFDALHLSWCLTETGAPQIKVAAGKPIAGTGNTGNSTGPHLHFQVRDLKTGKKFSPQKGYVLWALTGKEPHLQD